MRKDLQKLLCEQERRGSSRKYREVRRDKEFTVDYNEFSAGRESMTRRYMVKGNNKEFSENFAPLFGIIRKNVNRPWDKVFSELNEVFDMRNHVNAHILVHLWSFVATKTFIGKDGKVWITGQRYGEADVPLDASTEYYVHPTSGLLLRNQRYMSWKRMNREGAERRAAEERKTKIVISKELELRRRDENSPWFVCTMSFLKRPAPVYVWEERQYREGGKIYRYLRPSYPRTYIKDKWTKEYVQYDRYYVSGYRTASKKDLKKWGVL